MTSLTFLKNSWSGPWLIAVLCVLVLLSMMPAEATAQGITEYGAILAFVAVLVGLVFSLSQEDSTAAHILVQQLDTAVQGAAAANTAGDAVTELSQLSKAIGAAEALFGVTSSCGAACDNLRSDLQQVIGLAAQLKGAALGIVSSGSCNPNGVIQPNEQCDPLAVPTGCPVLTLPSFCNEQCQCQISP